MKYTLPRGTKDILPEEIAAWQFIEKTAADLFQKYNFQEIRTPIFESTELFARSIGSTTDIVSKEMYTFTDKGDRSLTLRPEETASVVRACLQANLIGSDKVTKLYYIGPMFRYERPQAGRFRQFHQAGVEVFGSSNPYIDVEVIALAVQLFKDLGLKNLEVDINSIGCKKCKPNYREKLRAFFKDKEKDLCEDCRERLKVNPLRILDCKNAKCNVYIKEAPSSLDSVCEECKKNFDAIIGLLGKLDIKFLINSRLVRGLDYYTGTTFEVISKQLGAQNAVCGGGRYDMLVEDLGGRSTPAIGFAIGIERAIEVLKADNAPIPKPKPVDIFVAYLGEEAKVVGFGIVQDARKNGLVSDMDHFGKNLKSQLKTADRLNAKFVYIVGEDELKKGAGILKNMDIGDQQEIKFNEVLNRLKEQS